LVDVKYTIINNLLSFLILNLFCENTLPLSQIANHRVNDYGKCN
jgi:hypothetical protein